MGTDIHMVVEQRQRDGSWKVVDPAPRECDWCDGRGHYENDTECYSCKGSGVIEKPYDTRCYNLFSILANVRNGYGFAGCDTGDGFQPIADPRGLPDDLSYDPERDEGSWLGDHSHTWLSLPEVMSCDYERVTRKRGVVDSAEFHKWVKGGRKIPDGWCGGCSGPNVVHVTNEEMQKLIDDGVAPTNSKAPNEFWLSSRDGKNYFTTIQWHETYREAVGEAWFRFLEACAALGDPERIRLVFGFDS